MVKSEDFLMKVYEDMKEDLRCRRNFESQLVYYFFLFYVAIGIATIPLFQTPNFPKIALSSSILIVLITSILTWRIVSDHRKYANIGQIAVRIWRYFEMFDKDAYLKCVPIIPEEKFKDHGKGSGYLFTIALLWSMTIGMLFVLWTL